VWLFCDLGCLGRPFCKRHNQYYAEDLGEEQGITRRPKPVSNEVLNSQCPLSVESKSSKILFRMGGRIGPVVAGTDCADQPASFSRASGSCILTSVFRILYSSSELPNSCLLPRLRSLCPAVDVLSGTSIGQGRRFARQIG
jgi:hypothetical protein